jgi:hypothetical protein
MRVAWVTVGALTLGAMVSMIACAGGDETTDVDDDGIVITGAGGATSATTAATTAASSSATTSSAGVGGAGGGGPPACLDLGIGEPNESEDTAFPLKASAISDCDGDGGTVSGTIAGAADIDWFSYEGDDKIGCVVDPTRSFSQSESGLRLCKFIECFNGNTEFSCPGGTTAATSPGGRKGCCGTTGFKISNLNCTGTLDEHARVFIRVDQPGATAATCNVYSLSYHY